MYFLGFHKKISCNEYMYLNLYTSTIMRNVLKLNLVKRVWILWTWLCFPENVFCNIRKLYNNLALNHSIWYSISQGAELLWSYSIATYGRYEKKNKYHVDSTSYNSAMITIRLIYTTGGVVLPNDKWYL